MTSHYRRQAAAVLVLMALFAGVTARASGLAGGSGASPLIDSPMLAGDFTQTIYDDQGRELSQSGGQFALLKPHFLRWETQWPGQELLIADQDTLWQYDKDLETVTQQALDTRAKAPLQLLIEPLDQLNKDYVVIQDGHGVTLSPRDENAGFHSLQLERNPETGAPQRFTIIDGLGQHIVVVLELAMNPELSPRDFDFIPPDGVNLTRMEP